MKTAYVREPSTISIEETEKPVLGSGDILVQMYACGICGSDLEKVFGKYGKPSMKLGHEPSGIILDVWGIFVFVISAFNWIYTIFSGKRLKELARLSEIWNTQRYVYYRYLTLVTNERPFPFESLTKSISKFKK